MVEEEGNRLVGEGMVRFQMVVVGSLVVEVEEVVGSLEVEEVARVGSHLVEEEAVEWQQHRPDRQEEEA